MSSIKNTAMLAGAIGVIYIAYRAKQELTQVVTETANPASEKNIIYRNTPQVVKNGLFSFWGTLDGVGILPR